MTISFKHLAVAAAATVSFASAQAATFAGSIENSFTLGADIVELLAKVALSAEGTATFDNVTKTLLMPATLTTLSNGNAADLITFSSGAGLTIQSGADTISLKDFSYNNATKALDAVISLNGVQKFSGTALTSTTAGVLGEVFNAANITGQLTTGTMKMTNGAASALTSALGYTGFTAAVVVNTVTAANFGTFQVNAIPEPSTYALMGLGLVGVALAARKRKAA